MRRALLLAALAAWPGCRPRQSLALHLLTPAGVVGTSDDPLAAVDTLEVRTEPPAAAAATSAPFREGRHGAIDVPTLLGDTPVTLDVVGIGNGSVLSLGRTMPLKSGAASASVYIGLIDAFQPTPMARDAALARYGATATAFAAGDAVLLAGGARERPPSASGLPALPRADALVAALELYDATRGSFRNVGSDLDARIHHAAVALPGAADAILVIGGWGTSGAGTTGPLDEVVRVTRAGDGVTVEHDGTLPMPLWGHTATLLSDGRVLIVGGYTDAAATSLAATAFVYTPGTGDSTPVTLGSPRAFAVATDLHDAAGEILVTGGIDGSGPRDDALVYQPQNRSFASPRSPGGSYRPTMRARRVGHTATLLADGHVLVVGGNDGTRSVAAPEVFDPVRLAFLAVDVSPSAAALEPRQNHQAVALDDGSLVVFAGEAADGATLALDPRVERLAPAGNAPGLDSDATSFPVVVTTIEDALPHATSLAAAATLADRSILYAAGSGAAGAADASAALFVPCYGACQTP